MVSKREKQQRFSTPRLPFFVTLFLYFQWHLDPLKSLKKLFVFVKSLHQGTNLPGTPAPLAIALPGTVHWRTTLEIPLASEETLAILPPSPKCLRIAHQLCLCREHPFQRAWLPSTQASSGLATSRHSPCLTVWVCSIRMPTSPGCFQEAPTGTTSHTTSPQPIVDLHRAPVYEGCITHTSQRLIFWAATCRVAGRPFKESSWRLCELGILSQPVWSRMADCGCME